jgi:hypothetical protein
VRRFNHDDVMRNRQGELEVIAAELAASPFPALPRRRGRERRARSTP